MATYGVDFYGLTKYGTDIAVQYDISPFVASSNGYGSVDLTWGRPQRSPDRMRLLRNRYGYAVNATDGDILLDTPYATDQFVDNDRPLGTIQYYTIFVFLDGAWVRAGTTSTLVARDNGYSERLYDLVPNYFKYGTRNLDGQVDENEQLQAFLAIFGFGFDYLKTFYDSLLRSHDADAVSVTNLERLAADLGMEFEHALPTRLMRQKVKNSGHLVRQKGMLDGLRNLINATTGWDVDLSIGNNLLLDNNQSSFTFPKVDPWNALVNYPKGERVFYQRFVYEALQGTLNNQPTGTRSDTAYWHCLGDADAKSYMDANSVYKDWYTKILNPDTGSVSTWEALALTAGVPGSAAVRISQGIPSPDDLTAEYRNGAFVENTSTTTTGDFALRSVSKLSGASSVDPAQAIKDGIPLRQVFTEWDATLDYVPGSLVTYKGRVHRALIENLNVAPAISGTAANAAWEPMGVDGRLRYCLSGFTHAPPSYPTGKPTAAVTPYVDLYDERGSLIVSVEARAYPQVVFDSFSGVWGTVASGRTPDVGSPTWTVTSGSWLTSGYSSGVLFPTGTGRQLLTMVGSADTQVAATFRTSPLGATSQGIVFRLSDTSNYWRAHRTGLHIVSAGVATAQVTWATPFADGDRMTVTLQGNNVSVKRNGTQIWTGSNSFNATATTHGLVVE